jgi:hypothetical protein
MDRCLNNFKGTDMNYTTHNQETIVTEGASLRGEVTATYKELTNLFGVPTKGDANKVEAHWAVKFSDGTVATVYNWKDSKSYLGEQGANVKDITEWRVGGFGPSATILVQLTLELMREAKPKDKIEEAFSSAFDMMDSIRSQKGENYARLVEVAMLTIKRREMIEMLVDMVSAATEMPEAIKGILLEADTAMSVKTISAACQASSVKFDSQSTADELMGWATRIIEAEVGGVETLVKGAKKK